ncbi:MAG: hypothetical protein E7636_05810 [Ruminococcaceae bacterium]|nr:hypothetical protein [Oscillospiraceae bacterium]MBQ2774061.1 UvrB/UvrC motif-containing protein [Clostridia bacterium]
MKCEKCNEKEASFFYEQTINGEKRSYHLCHTCAEEMGLITKGKAAFIEDPFSALFPAGYGNFIGDIFGLPQSLGVKAKKCEGCGVTWQDIAKSGKVGCPLCYGTFGDELERSIRSIHGNVTHVGRAPAERIAALEKKNRMVNLKSALKTAIEAENFEEAARLRDEIRALENAQKE